MIPTARWRKARGFAEDVVICDQELVQERPIGRCEGAQLRCRWRGDARLGEVLLAALERHRTGGEVPHNGAQCAEPPCTEHHVITSEGHHK